MREDDLYEQIAQYIQAKYAGVPYHFDLSGVWTPSHKARNLYGKVNQKAWPDLHIAKPRRTPFLGVHMEYAGLFLELKREGSASRRKTAPGPASISRSRRPCWTSLPSRDMLPSLQSATTRLRHSSTVTWRRHDYAAQTAVVSALRTHPAAQHMAIKAGQPPD